jgi:hypothetical protein
MCPLHEVHQRFEHTSNTKDVDGKDEHTKHSLVASKERPGVWASRGPAKRGLVGLIDKNPITTERLDRRGKRARV